MRRCWVNFQCRGVLQFGFTVGQGPTALAVGAGGGCLDIFTLIYPFFPLSPSLWETARYRLKYCLKGPLNPKSTNQPTNDLQYNKIVTDPRCCCCYYLCTNRVRPKGQSRRCIEKKLDKCAEQDYQMAKSSCVRFDL